MNKKILLVANTDWFLYNFRLELAKMLHQEEFDVTLVTPNGPYVQKFIDLGLAWIEWRVNRQTIAPWSEIPAVSSLRSIYRSKPPDLVHHHTMKAVLYGSVAARSLNVQSVVNSITGLGYIFSSNSPKARLLRSLIIPALRFALGHQNLHSIFENETDLDFMVDERISRTERSTIINSVGVDTKRFVPSIKTDGPPVIMMVGRMLWDKGVGVFVEAVSQLRGRLEFRTVLVGNPDPGNPGSIPKDQLSSWQDQGLIEWWGFQENMQDIYAQSDIIVLPTMYGEGVPKVLLEAAACARPIIATDIPGCRTVVRDGHNGLLVPTNDADSLAEAIGKLIVNPNLCQEMGTSGRAIIKERFSIEEVNRKTIAIYEKLLAR